MHILMLSFVLLLHGVHSLKHAVVVPKEFRSGAEETVILNLYGYPAGTRVNAILRPLPGLSNIIDQDNKQLDGKTVNKPIFLRLTVAMNRIHAFYQNQKVRLEIVISHDSKKITIDIPVSRRSGYLFITTDQPTYKPDDTVGYKIFALNQAMRPDDETEVTTTIIAPDGVGVHRKNNTLQPEETFIELDYSLNSLPQLGIWTIEANYTNEGYSTTAQTKFKVDRYVLPTFQVKIILEKKYILAGDSDIIGIIKAEYSYGKPVDGQCYMRALLKKTPNSIPIEFYEFPSNQNAMGTFEGGERRFRIPLQNLRNIYENGENIAILAENKASIIIETTVNGRADGVLESAISPDIKIVKSPYFIDTSRTSPYYTPSLSFTLQIDVFSSIGRKPAQNIPVIITVIGGEASTRQTDNHGSVNTLLNLQASGTQKITVKTDAPDLEPDQQATATIPITPYTSNSNSYLQITTSKTYVKVGDIWQVTFRFSNQGIHNREIRYFITAKGNIVLSDVQIAYPGNTDTVASIKITQEMVPYARVVAYYLVGREVVANSLWFDVENQCKEPLSLKVPKSVRPGFEFNIEVTGPSDAVVSLTGVDRAAYFLYNESRLTPKSMFDKMESYDLGCIRNGGRNADFVFQEAGLNLITTTNFVVTPLVCNSPSTSRKRRSIVNSVDANSGVDLKKCEEDGKLYPVVSTDTCESRALQVQNNAIEMNYPPGCAERFLEACNNETLRRNSNQWINVGRSTSVVRNRAIKNIDRTRQDFQEKLLFRDVHLPRNGKKSFSTVARDSITTYEIDAVSVSNTDDGFCVAQPGYVESFKDVFVQLYTPYSLKKLEQTNLRLTVFNYDDRDKELKVYIKIKKWEDREILCSYYTSGLWNQLTSFQVSQNDARSSYFTVLPLSIPEVDGLVTVSVKVTDSQNRLLDDVTKEILIEESGEPVETSHSEPIDLTNSTHQTFDLNFNFSGPFVPGSRKCWVYPYANFLGPSIEAALTAEKLNDVSDAFSVAKGCGWQAMSHSAPNVYALMYLNATGKTSSMSQEYIDIATKIRDGIKRKNNFSLCFTAPNTQWAESGQNNYLHLTDANEKYARPIEVPSQVINHGSIRVEANGVGEGVVSYRCVYRNIMNDMPCHFNISYTVRILNNDVQLQQKQIKLTIAVFKMSGEPNEMANIEVGLLSGYKPIEESLDKLLKDKAVDGKIDRYEVNNFKIIFYLKEITENITKLQFQMKQTVDVKYPQPAKINVYYYYKPTIRCGIFYHLNTHSPNLRTTNCSNHQSNSICKCAEGGCFTCRKREEQYTKTACIKSKNCVVCNGTNACLDLYTEVCRRSRSYAYLVRVADVNKPKAGAIFYTITADIITVARYGEHNVTSGDQAEFLVRKDCFDLCHDSYQAKSIKKKKNMMSEDYFAIGRQFFISGSAPDAVNKDGRKKYTYHLDVNSIVERYIPEKSCRKARKKVRNCKAKNTDKCKEAKQKKEICNNYNELIAQLVATSCDRI